MNKLFSRTVLTGLFKRSSHISFILVLFLLLTGSVAVSQIRGLPGAAGRMGGGGFGRSAGKADSLQHRTGMEDSITIKFRFLDSSRYVFFDSSVSDFTKKFPTPWTHVNLGNLGNASENRLFIPNMYGGWDHGFHSYDVYNFTLAETRFYNTTRPYSEINYVLGSLSEQMIGLMHTQNIKPNWNASFQYRLINSPGTFQNQNTNHNNYRFTSWYQSLNKRYQNFVVLLGNKLMSGESGGIREDANYIDSSAYLDNRYGIPTQLGRNNLASRNFFSTNIATGAFYTNATYLMRQQYDIGQKDSIVVNDTTVIPLFYPRIRLEHTVSYQTFKYRFKDYFADSTYYSNNYGLTLDDATDSVYRRDYWKDLSNDFSVYTFPDAKNSQQFIKLGATLQLLKADFDTGLRKAGYSNIRLHGEYRNKTRNRKWDIEAFGSFFAGGYNAGDYDVHAILKREVSPRFGYVEVGFENVNRTPSFVFNSESSFYFDQPSNLNKENNTHIFAALYRPRKQLKITGHYYLLSNYTYLKAYSKVDQVSSLFNLVQVQLEKDFKLGKKGWHWRTWVILQQKTGAADLNLPLLSTRNQLVYDGSLGFKNLRLSTGLELRYFSPYKANRYAPVQGQFFYQNAERIAMRAPEVSVFAHFRIKSFTAYARVENLNAASLNNGFSFTGNNVLLPRYGSPGMQIRVGIFWSFVN